MIPRFNGGDSVVSEVALGSADEGLFRAGVVTVGAGPMPMRSELRYCRSGDTVGPGDMMEPGDTVGPGDAMGPSDVVCPRDVAGPRDSAEPGDT